MRFILFQTLPGVILHFYKATGADAYADVMFQTLPGVILHFYNLRESLLLRFSLVSNPSRGYSTFLLGFDNDGTGHLVCFKPFQGLFYISTSGY